MFCKNAFWKFSSYSTDPETCIICTKELWSCSGRLTLPETLVYDYLSSQMYPYTPTQPSSSTCLFEKICIMHAGNDCIFSSFFPHGVILLLLTSVRIWAHTVSGLILSYCWRTFMTRSSMICRVSGGESQYCRHSCSAGLGTYRSKNNKYGRHHVWSINKKANNRSKCVHNLFLSLDVVDQPRQVWHLSFVLEMQGII